MSDSRSRLLKRFVAHLPLESTDRILVVLKGHLLVEELLREYVSKQFHNPSELVDARLTFYQCLCLARAADTDASHEKLWLVVERLNTLRNKLAHSLEPKDLEATIRGFVEMQSNFDPIAPYVDSEKKFGALAVCMLDICMSLSYAVPPSAPVSVQATLRSSHSIEGAS
jgi:hypothetical protein